MPRRIPDPRLCAVCGTAFVPSPNRFKARFCSKKCVYTGTSTPERLARLIEAGRASAESRGDAQRGRGEGKSYRKKNGRHEHRVVAEAILGRPLRRGEVVHHLDGDHLNNDPNNLEVISQAEHMQRHGLGIPGNPLTHKPWEYRK